MHVTREQQCATAAHTVFQNAVGAAFSTKSALRLQYTDTLVSVFVELLVMVIRSTLYQPNGDERCDRHIWAITI